MSFIRTVLGDIDPAALGVCYGHEHVIGQPPGTRPGTDLDFTEEAAAERELGLYKHAGGSGLIEMTTPDYGRDAAALIRISQVTGVHLVAATGYNKDKFSLPFTRDASIDALTQRFVDDIMTGMDGTTARAGLVKAAANLNDISAAEEKLYRAAARTHRQTGAPISTHSEAGTMMLEQVALFHEEGVDLSHVVIGHVDRNLDLSLHRRLAESGVNLSYDQFAKEKYAPDSQRLRLIRQLVDDGFGGQILLAGDMAKRSYWPSYHTGGGPGLTFILWRILPWMREEGMPEDAIQAMLVDNPARIFQFRQPTV
jgi:phosphotriesterase-related protein